MLKHHLENLAEQIANKGQDSTLINSKKTSYQASEAAKAEDISTKVADENSSIQFRAYQIHIEKGGSGLDNWLEAERSLKNNVI